MNTSTDNKYYTYVLLNPLKPGTYKYGRYTFEYEPFYVGKGQGNRRKQHIAPHSIIKDTIKNKILRSILNSNLAPIYFGKQNIDEQHAFNLEIKLIKLIGRKDLGIGPLGNHTDGGDGTSGWKHSDKTKKKMSLSAVKRSKRLESTLSLNEKNIVKEKQRLSHSKSFIITDDKGNNYICNYGLNNFCVEHHLQYSTMRRYVNIGVVQSSIYKKSENRNNVLRQNCVGWEIKCDDFAGKLCIKIETKKKPKNSLLLSKLHQKLASDKYKLTDNENKEYICDTGLLNFCSIYNLSENTMRRNIDKCVITESKYKKGCRHNSIKRQNCVGWKITKIRD